jgi:hypothetical protein
MEQFSDKYPTIKLTPAQCLKIEARKRFLLSQVVFLQVKELERLKEAVNE